MRKPEENLDAFTFKAVEKSAEPPPMVTLHFAGEVEVLKPLARVEGVENPDPATGDPFRRPAPNRFSWFQSAVAAAAVLGIMIVIFLSAIFIGISDPSVSPDFASAGDPGDAAIDQPLTDEPLLSSEILTAQNSPLMSDEIVIVRPTAKRRIARRVRPAAYRPRRKLPRPQLITTTFIPTTLIIYPEDGEIKSRIEPQIAAVYKKPPTITN